MLNAIGKIVADYIQTQLKADIRIFYTIQNIHENSQTVIPVQSLKAWVKKAVKSKVAAKNNHKDVTGF